MKKISSSEAEAPRKNCPGSNHLTAPRLWAINLVHAKLKPRFMCCIEMLSNLNSIHHLF